MVGPVLMQLCWQLQLLMQIIPLRFSCWKWLTSSILRNSRYSFHIDRSGLIGYRFNLTVIHHVTVFTFRQFEDYAPCNRPWRPTELWESTLPHFLDNRLTDDGEAVSPMLRPPNPLKVNQRFGETCCLQYQDRRVKQETSLKQVANRATLNIKATCYSETSVDFQLTTRHCKEELG
jgi:hypothetical protein